MERLTSSKLHLGIEGGNPAAPLNHYKHNITSAA
jgi:hypothetical protein